MKTLRVRDIAAVGLCLRAAALTNFAADPISVVQSPPVAVTNHFHIANRAAVAKSIRETAHRRVTARLAATAT
jgi:hypothetical protein